MLAYIDYAVMLMVFEIQMYYVKLRMSIYVHELCEPLLTDICSVL